MPVTAGPEQVHRRDRATAIPEPSATRLRWQGDVMPAQDQISRETLATISREMVRLPPTRNWVLFLRPGCPGSDRLLILTSGGLLTRVREWPMRMLSRSGASTG
jgi:hypothetical protein